MKLCLSLSPGTMQEALAALTGASRGADLVELRMEGLRDPDLERLLRKPRPRLIITNRRREEGGSSTAAEGEQEELFTEASTLGAEYVDVEMSWGSPFVRKMISLCRKSTVICSHHDFTGTPADLTPIYRRMRSTGARVLKITTTARDITDNRRLFDLLLRARQDRQHLIALAMGEAGQVSRIIGGIYGGYLSYGSARAGQETAPGQLTLLELKETYRAGRINSRTKIFGLLGNPVRQSRGVSYHNANFQKKSLNAVYVNFLATDVKKFLAGFRGVFAGLSVTKPFKQAIPPFLDKIEGEAGPLGVVNTVIARRGKLLGYNTDLEAVESLLGKKTTLSRTQVAVIGTGATAATMAYASVSGGGRTTIAGRSAEKARALAHQLGCEWTTLDRIGELSPHIVMNGSSAGMTRGDGHPPDELALPPGFLRRGMLVMDAVYSPPRTALLEEAERAGCAIISGGELFQAQALLQTKLFAECLA